MFKKIRLLKQSQVPPGLNMSEQEPEGTRMNRSEQKALKTKLTFWLTGKYVNTNNHRRSVELCNWSYIWRWLKDESPLLRLGAIAVTALSPGSIPIPGLLRSSVVMIWTPARPNSIQTKKRQININKRPIYKSCSLLGRPWKVVQFQNKSSTFKILLPDSCQIR